MQRRVVFISIHAPRKGGDYSKHSVRKWSIGFQSTPPARGATCRWFESSRLHKFQSTPPARGATRAGRTTRLPDKFQSTPPARGATWAGGWRNYSHCISIHAPRKGGDVFHQSPLSPPSGYFNPRPPQGGRRRWQCLFHSSLLFQSTPPARGATTTTTRRFIFA